ncbi:unnamed protein product [Medioppia subpectinata]|uniref:Uncharacterized protein n=1 Tax=Medioppia subpectinata TaxID=1979941 RepID=A0A7R9LRS9_9ACAR|nr:unnamed protein product [Medioppia subpectinata]CAG2121135.1 unnamed protein product [Medioppia subpectinata]
MAGRADSCGVRRVLGIQRSGQSVWHRVNGGRVSTGRRCYTQPSHRCGSAHAIPPGLRTIHNTLRTDLRWIHCLLHCTRV